LLVEAVAKQLLGVIGVVVELAEQVAGIEEVAQLGELRIGLDQVGVIGIGVEAEQAVLAGGQLETRQPQRVDGLLSQIRR